MKSLDAGGIAGYGIQMKRGSAGREFGDRTITIRIAYDPAKIVNGEQPVIRYRDGGVERQ